MEERVTFESAGLKLAGVLHIPERLEPGERRPACLVLHGFGSNKNSKACIGPAKLLAEWGYFALRFDMRGCVSRHGVQHWSGTYVGARGGNPLGQRIYYYLTGDGRTADILDIIAEAGMVR